MNDHQTVSDTTFNSSPLRKAVHFDDTISIPPQSTTSTSVLTSSTSLTLPLIAEKPGVRFKLLILLLSLLIALIIGFILSLLLVTQLIQIPKSSPSSHRFHSILSEKYVVNNNNRLFAYLDPLWIEELDFSTNVCHDFYGFVCRKWLIDHPLSPLEFKRSWLTERSQDIRKQFAQTLTNLSEIYAYNHQMEVNKNPTEVITRELDIVDFDGLTPGKNE